MTKHLFLEQHIHGAFGIDFNTAEVDDVVFVAEKLVEYGIVAIFPTLVTDSVGNIRRQVARIKEASKKCSRIVGIHLEGIFINPEKKGIHNPKHFLQLTVDNYKLVEDDFIRIVTLAPELDEGLIEYLHEKGIKVQAGHCIGGELSKVDGITHIFNAMSGISHRGESTALSALVNDDLYTEVIADGLHVSDDALKLIFKSKPIDKIILVSDALPITKSDMSETFFAGSNIFYDGIKATSKGGTIAGSTTLLNDIVARLERLGLYRPEYIENVWRYHGLKPEDFE